MKAQTDCNQSCKENDADNVKRTYNQPDLFAEPGDILPTCELQIAAGLFVLDLIVKPLAETFRHLILDAVSN